MGKCWIWMGLVCQQFSINPSIDVYYCQHHHLDCQAAASIGKAHDERIFCNLFCRRFNAHHITSRAEVESEMRMLSELHWIIRRNKNCHFEAKMQNFVLKTNTEYRENMRGNPTQRESLPCTNLIVYSFRLFYDFVFHFLHTKSSFLWHFSASWWQIVTWIAFT